MPALQQQGITLDGEGLINIFSDLTGLDEFKDVLMFLEGEMGQAPVGEAPQKAPVTKHINERINRPGATMPGQEKVLQQALLGKDVQPDEAASLMRAVA